MKLLITYLLLVCTISIKPAGSTVFICDSKAAKVYHSSKSCNGIQKCTHKILEITLKKATDTYKRVACKICY